MKRLLAFLPIWAWVIIGIVALLILLYFGIGAYVRFMER